MRCRETAHGGCVSARLLYLRRGRPVVQKVPEEFNDDDELDPAARLGRQTLVEFRSFGQEVQERAVRHLDLSHGPGAGLASDDSRELTNNPAPTR